MKYLFTLLFVFLLHITFAQSEGFDKPLIKTSDKDSIKSGILRPVATDFEIKTKKPEGYPAKDLSENYTGFRIEIIASDTLLKDTSEVFFRHGKVVMEQLESGTFSYTVGDFKDEPSARAFMETFIKPVYQEPRIIKYENGKRM